MRSLKIFVLFVVIPVAFSYRYATGQENIVVQVVPVVDTLDGCGSRQITLVVEAPELSLQDSVVGFDLVVGYDSTIMSINNGYKINTVSESMDEVVFSLMPGEARIAAGNITRFIRGTQKPLVALGGEVFDCLSESSVFVKRAYVTLKKNGQWTEGLASSGSSATVVVQPEDKVDRHLVLNSSVLDTLVFDTTQTQHTLPIHVNVNSEDAQVTAAHLRLTLDNDVSVFTIEDVVSTTVNVEVEPKEGTNNVWDVYCSVVDGTLLKQELDITLKRTADVDSRDGITLTVVSTNSCSCVFASSAQYYVPLKSVETIVGVNEKLQQHDIKLVMDGNTLGIHRSNDNSELVRIFDTLGRLVAEVEMDAARYQQLELPTSIRHFIIVEYFKSGHYKAMNIIR